ncbi:MAG: hypothetical protein QOF71_216 [Candidatus Eremiobacteraeota bacterium]|nr:hypothetical protein [Candidatus Eremiobacteraeota bacterium]
MKGWYIDSLDAAAGLAFASLRPPDDEERTAYADAAHTYFIAPPFFVPEPTTRSIALAARRGTFQPGFYIGESEFAFESLSRIVEFVRRVYLGNEGTEPTPGAGLGPPPESPAPQADRGPWDFRGGPLADAIARFDRLPVGTGCVEECPWTEWLGLAQRVVPLQPAPDLVGSAIGCLAEELLGRHVAHRAGDAVRAVRSWAALVAIVRRVTPYDFTFPDWIQERLVKLGLPEKWRQSFVLSETSVRFGDPYEAMRLVPLPGRLREQLRPNAPDVETLGQLLSLVMSSPSHVPSAERASVADLILLCAAAIVSPAAFGAEIVPGPIPLGERVVNDAWRALTETALAWCGSSLPQLKFDARVEEAIRSAAKLARGAKTEPPAPITVADTSARASSENRDDDEHRERGQFAGA